MATDLTAPLDAFFHARTLDPRRAAASLRGHPIEAVAASVVDGPPMAFDGCHGLTRQDRADPLRRARLGGRAAGIADAVPGALRSGRASRNRRASVVDAAE